MIWLTYLGLMFSHDGKGPMSTLYLSPSTSSYGIPVGRQRKSRRFKSKSESKKAIVIMDAEAIDFSAASTSSS